MVLLDIKELKIKELMDSCRHEGYKSMQKIKEILTTEPRCIIRTLRKTSRFSAGHRWTWGNASAI